MGVKDHNEKVKSDSITISLRVKKGTDISKIYSELFTSYDSTTTLMEDAMWALYEKKYPDKVDVEVFEKIIEKRTLKSDV